MMEFRLKQQSASRQIKQGTRTRRAAATACLLAGAMLTAAATNPTPAQAAATIIADEFAAPMFYAPYVGPTRWYVVESSEARTEAAPITSWWATYNLTNVGATREPGEPSFRDRMNNTIWARVRPAAQSRIVIHTFGSDFDTALAAYTGDAVDNLRAVKRNDNFRVPGFGNKSSLIQFDAKKRTNYYVQFGSKTGDVGTLIHSIYVFPKEGGLSAFLATQEGSLHRNRQFVCAIKAGASCDDPTFVLHNSTDRRVQVKSSTNLGPGVEAPANVALDPGEATLVTFKFRGGFDNTTTRTETGFFTFQVRKGQQPIGTTNVPGLITVQPNLDAPDVLTLSSRPAIQSNWLNVGNRFKVKLKNNGTNSAIGCHARPDILKELIVNWQQINPKNGKPVKAPNTPMNIAPGRTKTFIVDVRSRQYRLGDPEFRSVIIDCANANWAPHHLKNGFDFSAAGNMRLARVNTRIFSPAGDKLNVPDGGETTFRAQIRSTGTSATVIVRPNFIYPFSEFDPNKEYPLTICLLTAKNGNCEAPAGFSVQYDTERGVTRYVKVFVEAPVTDPGFNAKTRRIFLKVMHKRPPDGDGASEVPISADSIAPQVN